jgi:hypothetical protein
LPGPDCTSPLARLVDEDHPRCRDRTALHPWPAWLMRTIHVAGTGLHFTPWPAWLMRTIHVAGTGPWKETVSDAGMVVLWTHGSGAGYWTSPVWPLARWYCWSWW